MGTKRKLSEAGEQDKLGLPPLRACVATYTEDGSEAEGEGGDEDFFQYTGRVFDVLWGYVNANIFLSSPKSEQGKFLAKAAVNLCDWKTALDQGKDARVSRIHADIFIENLSAHELSTLPIDVTPTKAIQFFEHEPSADEILSRDDMHVQMYKKFIDSLHNMVYSPDSPRCQHLDDGFKQLSDEIKRMIDRHTVAIAACQEEWQRMLDMIQSPMG